MFNALVILTCFHFLSHNLDRLNSSFFWGWKNVHVNTFRYWNAIFGNFRHGVAFNCHIMIVHSIFQYPSSRLGFV